MCSRYLVVDSALGEDIVVAEKTGDINVAIQKFKEIAAKALDASIILYDSEKDNICRVFMQSEPIKLVQAIEYARLSTSRSIIPETTIGNDDVKVSERVETKLIESIAETLSKTGPFEGIANEDTELIIAPYMVLQREGAGTAGAAVGVYGGLSASILGFIFGGAVGAVAGGMIGAVGLGTGTKSLIDKFLSAKKCMYCRGTGLEGNNYRCSECDGYGYIK